MKRFEKRLLLKPDSGYFTEKSGRGSGASKRLQWKGLILFSEEESEGSESEGPGLLAKNKVYLRLLLGSLYVWTRFLKEPDSGYFVGR